MEQDASFTPYVQIRRYNMGSDREQANGPTRNQAYGPMTWYSLGCAAKKRSSEYEKSFDIEWNCQSSLHDSV